MQDPHPQTLSALIGAVYDCALDPGRGPDALRDLAELIEDEAGQLYLLDLDADARGFGTGWGEAPEATRLLAAPDREMGPGWRREALPVGEAPQTADAPIVLRRLPQAATLERSGFYRAWAGTLGYCDAIRAVVLQRGRDVALLCAARHRDQGLARARRLALLRLLGPHLRRAVALGDLLDARAAEVEALGGAMDRLALGIGIVAADGRLLHANVAAQAMLAAPDGPIRSAGGRLAARRSGPAAALQGAIAAAASGRDRRSVGVALAEAGSDAPAVAQVLPLPAGTRRRRAAAAVVVAAGGRAAPPDLDAVLRSLGLTPGEARVLERLVAGDTLAEAAAVLGIAPTTAKTHLGRIMGKASVTRQAELIALVARLAPPVLA